MPLIDAKCQACGTISEVFRPLAMYPQTPPCPKCEGATEQIHLPQAARVPAPATVVYRATDGSFRFPGTTDPQSRTAKQYAKLGYERLEVSGWAAVRSLEKQMNARERGEINKRVERQCQFREESMAYRRSEITNGLNQGFQIPDYDSRGRLTGRMRTVKMSAEARDLMRAAQERNYRKGGPKPSDPGMFVEAYSMDRSNRESSRGPDGRRMRD